jgi:hypothetical protein
MIVYHERRYEGRGGGCCGCCGCLMLGLLALAALGIVGATLRVLGAAAGAG